MQLKLSEMTMEKFCIIVTVMMTVVVVAPVMTISMILVMKIVKEMIMVM